MAKAIPNGKRAGGPPRFCRQAGCAFGVPVARIGGVFFGMLRGRSSGLPHLMSVIGNFAVIPFRFVALACLALALPVLAGPNDVPDVIKTDDVLPFEPIKRRVVQETPGEYMGVQFDQNSLVYRFRFLRDGNVINVDVDARTGQRVRRRQSY